MKKVFEVGIPEFIFKQETKEIVEKALKAKDLFSNWNPYGRIEELAFAHNPTFDFVFDSKVFLQHFDSKKLVLNEFKELLIKNNIRDPMVVLELINVDSEHYETIEPFVDSAKSIEEIFTVSLKDLTDNYEKILLQKGCIHLFESPIT